jgi:hypothetical protein
MPLLMLSADNGLAPHTDTLVAEVRTQGGTRVTSQHVATDHGWSDRRIEPETLIIRWLENLHWATIAVTGNLLGDAVVFRRNPNMGGRS